MDDTDLISTRAEVFRSKLISDFHLLESITKGGHRVEAPRYYTSDMLDHTSLVEVMSKHPNGLVRFQVCKQFHAISMADRRKNRLKNKNSKYPPIDLWAHWLTSSNIFQNLILSLILVNSIVLGIQAEITDRQDSSLEPWKLSLDIFDYCSLIIFLVEIFIKWLDNFKSFWKNNWNIFDFVVTFLSIIPEVISLATGTFGDRNESTTASTTADLAVVASNLRTFRVLRSLKVVARFQKVKLIVLAVTKAFQSMVFITVLLFIFAYIFAIFGVIYFRTLYRTAIEEGAELYYVDSFESIIAALITLFQLFTLDHWREVFNDATSVSNYSFAFFYIIFWILIGSFIFKNIFVGIMVNNFQSIRNDLFVEVKVIHERENREIEMEQFADELARQDRITFNAGNDDEFSASGDIRHTSTEARYASKAELMTAHSDHLAKLAKGGAEWQKIVERNVENLAKEDTLFCWPKDSLFRYFLIMEALMENLKEREDLLRFLSQALMQIHDT